MKDKEELRKLLKTARAGFKGAQRERADGLIFKNAYGLLNNYKSVFIYNSFASEASTKRLIERLLKDGKLVYLPRVEGENMVAVPCCGEMQRGAFGIEEPVGQAFYGDIEATVIPLLGVNAGGYRIGYGRGYYDGYLRGRQTLKIGLGYSFQMVDFEEDGWDIPLDYFVCEKGIF